MLNLIDKTNLYLKFLYENLLMTDNSNTIPLSAFLYIIAIRITIGDLIKYKRFVKSIEPKDMTEEDINTRKKLLKKLIYNDISMFGGVITCDIAIFTCNIVYALCFLIICTLIYIILDIYFEKKH